MLSSDFHCKENDEFPVVPVHPGLAGIHKQWPYFINTIITGDESWVYGYDPEPDIFAYNENPTKALNTNSLKWYLPSNGATDRREKVHACVGQFKLFVEIHQVFAKKKVGYFFNIAVFLILCTECILIKRSFSWNHIKHSQERRYS